MVASPTGEADTSLFQVIDISHLKHCANIKFELSFKYFYRSYGSSFNNDHSFSVDFSFLEKLTLSAQLLDAIVNPFLSQGEQLIVDIGIGLLLTHPITIKFPIVLHNSYKTHQHFPASTDNEWREHHDSFYYTNAGINGFPLDKLIISFTDIAKKYERLRFGIDDVKLFAICQN